MTKFITLAITMFFCMKSIAAEIPTHPAFADKPLPDGTDVALLVVDTETDKTFYSQRADQFQQPASLQKLITGLAAKLFLKDDFRFETTVKSHQNHIVMQFSGDPTFNHTNLRALIERLKIHTTNIEGNLYLNGAVFDAFERAIGVPWDILGVCYSAPSSSITLNGNCVYGKLAATSTAPIKAVKASAPDHISLNAGDVVLREGLNHPDFDCELKLTAQNDNHYTVGGCVETHRLPVNFHLAVQNPTIYTAKIIKEELERAGIRLQGEIIRNDKVSGTLITSHRSAPINELIDTMVKDSDNLIADNLLKTIGQQYFNQPGSFENGAAAIKAILKSEANIDLSRAVIADGSGLSRNNRMTATQIMYVVRYIFKRPDLGLIQTMPVSGVSGTLRYRPSLAQPHLKGKITAKTGAIFATYNLAGQIQTQSGKSLLFVQLVSNYHPAGKRNTRQPLRAYERALYDGLFNGH